MTAKSDRCVAMVATYSYLPRAFTSLESFLCHNRDCDAIILVADLSRDAISAVTWPLPEQVRVVGMDELDDGEVSRMHGYFNALEFCCATKTFLVEHAISRWCYKKVVLLDPDTLCFSSFDDVWSVLEKSEIAITPHSNSPMPDDGFLPNDRELATAGFANAGFWAVSSMNSTIQILRWLKERLVHYGFFSPGDGLYADQTWLSCLPWYFHDKVTVLHHPGLNVAYWNFHERTLSRKGEQLFSNDEPLMMLHLSGYKESVPERLTVHPSRPLGFENSKIMGDILTQYRRALSEWAARMPIISPDRPCVDAKLEMRVRRYRNISGRPSPLGNRMRVVNLLRRAKDIIITPIQHLLR